MNTIETIIREIAQNAKHGSRNLVTLTTEEKNNALLQIADFLEMKKDFIQEANQKDLEKARENNLSTAMIDRLRLSDNVVASMVDGVRQVANLIDPVGTISNMTKQAKNIRVGRMRIPLGVICMIYESRPNVTVDAAVLCLKAGNSIVLRGGSEAFHSNMALASVLQEALEKCGIDKNVIQVIPVVDREAVLLLLKQEESIDLVIPRGGEGLIRFVAENSRIPVLKHYKGVCHIYVDRMADLVKATPIIINAKTQRPGVCNALEGLLVHKDVADRYVPEIAKVLNEIGVKILGCERSAALSAYIEKASNEDWGTEFLDLILCLKIVDGYEEARQYITQYGSQHTECVITEDYSLANKFIQEIDASAVMVNASTRFNDGGQLGLGTEIGISTSKLHAYGPMGLEELTTQKFIVFGEGQVRG